jgi:hypothetical protein
VANKIIALFAALAGPVAAVGTLIHKIKRWQRAWPPMVLLPAATAALGGTQTRRQIYSG